MSFGTFQGWEELGVLAFGSMVLGFLAARHRWARLAGVGIAALIVLGLVVQGVLIWQSEGEDRMWGQAAFVVFFLPAGGALALLYGLGCLAGSVGVRGRGTRP